MQLERISAMGARERICLLDHANERAMAFHNARKRDLAIIRIGNRLCGGAKSRSSLLGLLFLSSHCRSIRLVSAASMVLSM